MRSIGAILETKKLCLRIRGNLVLTIALGVILLTTGCNQKALPLDLGKTKNVNNISSQSNGHPKNVVYSEGKYRPAPGYIWINPNNQQDLRVDPKNVIVNADGKFIPAPGYTWVNPNNQKDLRVKK